jgi:transposase-like protein
VTANTTAERDPRDLPNYTLSEAARWLGLVPNTLRVWLRGQDYPTRIGKRRAQPVVHPAGPDPLGLSFLNLVECSVLATIRKQHEVSLQKVVFRGVERVRINLDGNHRVTLSAAAEHQPLSNQRAYGVRDHPPATGVVASS